MAEALNCSYRDILDMSFINFMMYGKTLNRADRSVSPAPTAQRVSKGARGSTYTFNSLGDLQKTLDKII